MSNCQIISAAGLIHGLARGVPTVVLLAVIMGFCGCASQTSEKKQVLPSSSHSPNAVLRVSGYCRISTNDGRGTKPLRPVPIPDGAILESVTGDLDLQLHSGQILIHVPKGSRVKIEHAVSVAGDTETMLDLRQGSLFGLVQNLSPASKCTIKLPIGVLGTRGATAFETHADGLTRCQTGLVIPVFVNVDGCGLAILTPGMFGYPQSSGKVTFGTNDVIATERMKEEFAKLERLFPLPRP